MLTKSNRKVVPVRPTLEGLEERTLLSAAGAVTGNDFLQVNLVANVAGVAANTDPNLIHPTGISVGPAGPFWVSDSGANVSTLYNTAGNPNALVVATNNGGSVGLQRYPANFATARPTSVGRNRRESSRTYSRLSNV